jgi:hypothetical protein
MLLSDSLFIIVALTPAQKVKASTQFSYTSHKKCSRFMEGELVNMWE